MTPLLIYFAKVIICSAVLYGYYYIALRNNRFHQWNRYYLVLITLVSLLTPLLHIPLPGQAQEPSAVLSYTARIITFRESVMPAASPVISFSTAIPALYLLMTGILLARVLVSLFKIKNLIFRSQVQEVPPYRFVKHKDIKAPFSFFTYIFWDQQTPLNSPEGQQILKHELVHLQEKHSADKFFMEIITAICWINPFFHLIKRELALVHEFLADKKAAEGEVAGYAQTILQMAFQSKQFSITNDFFHPPIKRRILMLTQFHTPRFSYLRRLLVLPLTAVVFCSFAFVACKNEAVIEPPVADNTPLQTPAVSDTDQTVFTIVEQPPVFKGGGDSLRFYLSRNIHYPKTAQEKGISGTALIQFVIDKEGQLKDALLIGKDPGAGIGAEALRVVKNMPKWVPGKQNGNPVNVQFNLPIRFTLQE